MRNFQFLTLLAVYLLFATKAVAVECDKLSNVDAVINCLINNHPQLRLAEIDVKIAKGQINKASQRINPKLEWEGTEAQNADGFSHELNLKHTIELGSKQSARVKLAEAGADIQKVNFEKEYNNIKIQLIINFYRYRQILHEMEFVKENKETFEKMISQYKRISKLNPEQEISLNVFTMSLEEVRLKLHHLENERDEILSNFEFVLQKKYIPTESQLPPVNHHWPDLHTGSLQGALAKEADAKVIEAQKSYSLEKAKSWPNISVGPRVQTVPGPQGGTFIGAAATIPIPILSLNGGGREKALAERRKRELEKKLIKRRLKVESNRLLNTYKRSIRSHSKAIKSRTILKKHKKLHKMIARGVVSPAMVIELHREIIEFYESLHEHELDAVKTRWQYYALHGKLDEKNILGTEEHQ